MAVRRIRRRLPARANRNSDRNSFAQIPFFIFPYIYFPIDQAIDLARIFYAFLGFRAVFASQVINVASD